MIVYYDRIPRGSMIVIPLDLDADDGETADDFAVSSWLRFARYRAEQVTADMPKVAEFTVEPRDDRSGWLLVLEPEDSAALEPGFYLADVKVEDRISDRLALIEITLPVTGGT